MMSGSNGRKRWSLKLFFSSSEYYVPGIAKITFLYSTVDVHWFANSQCFYTLIKMNLYIDTGKNELSAAEAISNIYL